MDAGARRNDRSTARRKKSRGDAATVAPAIEVARARCVTLATLVLSRRSLNVTYFVIAIVFGVIGALIGSGKGRGGLGFVLGALLSLIGIIIIAVMDPSPDHVAARGARPAGAGPTLGPSLETRLRDLDGLRATGALSNDEYLAERARVLASI